MKKSILIPYEKYQRLIKQKQPEQTVERKEIHIEDTEQMGGVGLPSDHILDSMPKRYKFKVGSIVSHILRDPQNTLSWNEAGELLYHGTLIPGSHIIDLLKDTQYQHKGYQLKGITEFYKGLQEIHVPTTLIRVLTNVSIKPVRIPSVKRPPGIPQKKFKKWIHV